MNAPNVDFSGVDSLPVAQEFVLLPSNDSLPIRYATRAAKFFNVNTLTLLLEGAVDGGSFIELNYLGFEGEFSQVKQRQELCFVNNALIIFLESGGCC